MKKYKKEFKESFKPNFSSKNQFIYYLRSTLLPDLKHSGYEETAQDFEEAIYWLSK